jgi:hypothetical protein
MTTMEGADRARALLGVRRWGDEVTDGAADVPAAEVGAAGVIAYTWRTSSVRAAVYAFDDQDAARAAEESLQASGSAGRVLATTVNGALLMVASAADDDLAGQELLGELRSNFAGRERDRE